MGGMKDEDKPQSVTMCGVSGWAIGVPQIKTQFGNDPNVKVMEYGSDADMVAGINAGECQAGLFDASTSADMTGLEKVMDMPGASGGVSFMGNTKAEKTKCALAAMNKGITILREHGKLQEIWDNTPGSENADAVENDFEFNNYPGQDHCH